MVEISKDIIFASEDSFEHKIMFQKFVHCYTFGNKDALVSGISLKE